MGFFREQILCKVKETLRYDRILVWTQIFELKNLTQLRPSNVYSINF